MLNNRYAPIVGLILILGASPTQSRADESSTVSDDFRAQLAERDAIIIELQHAVAELSKRVAALEREVQGESPADATMRPSDGSAPAQTSRRSDSGRLVVDEIAAERALERTLVQAGALLLPQGAFEITPSLSMGVRDLDVTTVVDTGAGDELGVLRVDRSSYSLGLTARIGLPFDSQLELGIPYQRVTEEAALSVLDGAIGDVSRTGSGAGDFVIGISKTLLRENGSAPDVVGRLTWNTGEGTETDNDVVLGGGFSSITGSLSFVKRLDPLALFLALDYQDSGSNRGIAPGNAFGISFGTGLAVSPESSLFGSITHRSVSETKIDGETVANSDLDITSLTLGFSTILRRGTLLNLYTEIGMSDAAADYTLGFSMPMRMR
jgi:hypothetical protein